jgi:hypothetical protein
MASKPRRRSKPTVKSQFNKMRDKVQHKHQLMQMTLTDLSKRRTLKSITTVKQPTLGQRARQKFGVIHAIVMGLIEECTTKTMFIVEDIQRMTVLPGPDVAFAIRDLIGIGFVSRTLVRGLYSLPSNQEVATSAE